MIRRECRRVPLPHVSIEFLQVAGVDLGVEQWTDGSGLPHLCPHRLHSGKQDSQTFKITTFIVKEAQEKQPSSQIHISFSNQLKLLIMDTQSSSY